MSRPRVELAAALAHVLPDRYRVIDHQRSVDRIEAGERVVVVYHHRFRPMLNTAREVELDVVVCVPELDPGKADDAVDDALVDLLAGVRAVPQVTWTDAERIEWGEWPAYKLTVTAVDTQ